MPRAKAKIRDASRELKFPLGYVHPDGYVCAAICHKDERGFWRSGYGFEHRLLMEWRLGRRLSSDEYVFHLDHDRTNNQRENLALLSREDFYAMTTTLMRKAKKFRHKGGSLRSKGGKRLKQEKVQKMKKVKVDNGKEGMKFR